MPPSPRFVQPSRTVLSGSHAGPGTEAVGGPHRPAVSCPIVVRFGIRLIADPGRAVGNPAGRHGPAEETL